MKLKLALCLTLLLVRVDGQTLNVSECVGPLTAAPNCDFYGSKLDACNSLVGSAAAQCFCQQTVLDAIAGCESEFRICVEGYEFDSQFQGPQGLFADWHSACDRTITYTPTTPAITSLSATLDQANCLSAESYCSAFGASTDSCSSAYTLVEQLQNCWCQATILNLVSRCEIDGSVSCLLQTPTTTELWSYKNCRGSVMESASPSVTSSRVIVTSQAPTTASTLSPSSPPATATVAATGAAASKGAASHLLQPNWLLLETIVVAACIKLRYWDLRY